MRRIGLWFFVPSLILTIPFSASAWGTKGHRVVASIAEDLLTPEAQREVTALLDPGTTLADISTWADEVRSSRRNTRPWHYVNIPRGSGGHVGAGQLREPGRLSSPAPTVRGVRRQRPREAIGVTQTTVWLTEDLRWRAS